MPPFFSTILRDAAFVSSTVISTRSIPIALFAVAVAALARPNVVADVSTEFLQIIRQGMPYRDPSDEFPRRQARSWNTVHILRADSLRDCNQLLALRTRRNHRRAQWPTSADIDWRSRWT